MQQSEQDDQHKDIGKRYTDAHLGKCQRREPKACAEQNTSQNASEAVTAVVVGDGYVQPYCDF